MLRIFCSALTLLALACTSQQTHVAQPEPAPAPPAVDDTSDPPRSPDPGSATCHWTVGGRCFDSAEAACAAAGCGVDVCIQAKSLPVQVSCP